MLDPMKHNYMKKVMELFRQGKLRPGIMPADICHDDWCGIYKGGYCNCDPEIKVYRVVDVERN